VGADGELRLNSRLASGVTAEPHWLERDRKRHQLARMERVEARA
jgi:hypothetical protein